ncbi:ArsR/SmtB family transcription factor [Brevibacillus nitrificans]|uniref:ArsR/SmtB family transcription factor n=1 Tax=Brevibacillus nitrificans TaxID=651560 RepID=UPI002609EA5E|nr:metalloregulator ArsR/SmtB family transcription factor [Brevibacillus nitrificans]MED1796620.1 metalloregulator ArsR/SmtB family transcription factor [Brevibacillus nitrificans]
MTIKLTNQDEKRAKIFKALADVKRIEIIRHLYLGQKNLTCGDIGAANGLNKSNASYHLKILQEADLIDVEREGQFKIITLREETFQEFLPGYLATL